MIHEAMTPDDFDQWLFEEAQRIFKRCTVILAENGLTIDQIEQASPKLLDAITTWAEAERQSFPERTLH